MPHATRIVAHAAAAWSFPLLIGLVGCSKESIADHYVNKYAGPHGVTMHSTVGTREINAPRTRVYVDYAGNPHVVDVDADETHTNVRTEAVP